MRTGTSTDQGWVQQLRDQGACAEAVEWAKGYSSLAEAWQACARADWLLWWLGRTLPDTQAHREALTCIAIRIVQAIPNRQPIAGWDDWATAYLTGTNRTDKAWVAAAKARVAAAAAVAWVAAAAAAAWAAEAVAEAAAAVAAAVAAVAEAAAVAAVAEAAAEAGARAAADIVREYYPHAPA